MASLVGTAARTSALITGDGIAVLVLLAPQFYFILLGALDASLAHLDVVLDLCFRELTVLPEDDVEAQSEDAQSDKHYGSKQDLHFSLSVNLVDEA